MFTDGELAYLATQRLGRLATLQPNGSLQNSPVGFCYNARLETIDIGGRDMEASQKFRNVEGNGQVALVVDDIASVNPWRVRCLEIRGSAEALRATGSHTLIVDCNAIAPDTVREIAGVIEGAGGRFLDAGIIGPPPRGEAKTKLFVSGPGAADLQQLAGTQLIVHVISDRIGDASALKMCYGALNKGTQALWLEVLIAAERLGVGGLLDQQLQQSQADLYDWALGQFPSLPPKAFRWAPEMLEISRTLATAGMSPQVFQGAADIYRFVAGTALGKETPENRDKAREGKDVVRLLAQERSR